MKIGFLGAGTISDAVIRGICKADTLDIGTIFVSKRNAQIAAKLEQDFSQVMIASSNQALVDRSDIVFVALPGAVCQKELTALQFSTNQKLVSFVPNASRSELREWTQQKAQVFRAMPLPFIAKHKSATPLFPKDKGLQQIFSATGGYIIAEAEEQFNLFMTAGSMMGVYYHFCEVCADWLNQQGLNKGEATHYVAQIFSALAEEAVNSSQNGKDFQSLQREYSTKGGTNELIANSFVAQNGDDDLRKAIEAGFKRITQN